MAIFRVWVITISRYYLVLCCQLQFPLRCQMSTSIELSWLALRASSGGHFRATPQYRYRISPVTCDLALPGPGTPPTLTSAPRTHQRVYCSPGPLRTHRGQVSTDS